MVMYPGVQFPPSNLPDFSLGENQVLKIRDLLEKILCKILVFPLGKQSQATVYPIRTNFF